MQPLAESGIANLLTDILHYLFRLGADARPEGFDRSGRRAKKIGACTKIEKPLIQGPAGKLEALLESDPGTNPPLATLVCHPHPVFGGTMHNKVVFHAAKAAVQLGLPCLRFNFRGVGESQGEYAEGIGERNDARAALDYLETRFPQTPVCVMGFSFGAWVGLAVGADDPRTIAVVGLGLPAGMMDFSFLLDVRKPKLIVQGNRDIYGTRDQVEGLFKTLHTPKRLHWVEGGDHFFAGRLDEVQAEISKFLGEMTPQTR
ncbi:MAG TPA: alpha/beta family hydrolase [Terriglobia bacterium]|nr:alpha/beta family hydrolase [Terriglobia bacterium]